MYFNFAFFLTFFVIVSGIIALWDRVSLRASRAKSGAKEPWWVDYSRSLFPVLLAVWVIRSFIIQPYHVPTGSLEPTVLPGDFIAVSQYAYGVRLPVIHTKIIPVGEPKRGDIALFHWPVNPGLTFVKRVIGVPGDRVSYINKILYVNGKEAKQQFVKNTYDEFNDGLPPRAVKEYTENLAGVKHQIYVQPVGGEIKNFSITVPAHEYFMMGDNRDNSDDSRMWGFVPEKDLIGKAWVIWMSWNPLVHSWNPFKHVRWHRIGTSLEPRA